MTTEDDLRAAVETVAAHLRPGGAALFLPDTTREAFSPHTDHGGHDGEDGRGLRYLQWVRDEDPEDDAYETDFAILLREPGELTRVVYERHTTGMFSLATWQRLLEGAGLVVVDPGVVDPHEGEHAVFAARRPS
jgi:hypothetical protein